MKRVLIFLGLVAAVVILFIAALGEVMWLTYSIGGLLAAGLIYVCWRIAKEITE